MCTEQQNTNDKFHGLSRGIKVRMKQGWLRVRKTEKINDGPEKLKIYFVFRDAADKVSLQCSEIILDLFISRQDFINEGIILFCC